MGYPRPIPAPVECVCTIDAGRLAARKLGDTRQTSVSDKSNLLTFDQIHESIDYLPTNAQHELAMAIFLKKIYVQHNHIIKYQILNPIYRLGLYKSLSQD